MYFPTPFIRYLPDTLSNPRILFMPCRLNTTSSNTGTEPPTRPVLPPWGTTANLRIQGGLMLHPYCLGDTYFCWLQYFMISETCCVVFGFNTSCDLPRNLCIQSVLKANRSSWLSWIRPCSPTMVLKCSTSWAVSYVGIHVSVCGCVNGVLHWLTFLKLSLRT